MRIGVDVGGTNTDAVLMDGRTVVASVKTHTTADVMTGIIDGIAQLLSHAQLSPDAISSVMIGTTQFTNALVERRGLAEVAAVRLALPSGQAAAPKIGWPEDLVQAIGDHVYELPGGYEFDGSEIAPFDPESVRKAARDIAAKGVGAVAISCANACVNAEMERRAATILREENPDLDITLSSDIGRVGLLERENSAIINAACAGLARDVIRSFAEALKKSGIAAPFYITQNDGTLISADTAERQPVLTFASGPTNSIRGAAFLSGIRDGIVMDIGGTTCDIGVLKHGFPRESSIDVDVGGVRTNFRMPDVLAIGLGGGSIIRPAEEDAEVYRIGPQSVGFELMQKARVFGGEVLTATDIAVAANPDLKIGDASLVAELPPETISRLKAQMTQMCAKGLDQMKTDARDLPVILVGGGAILIDGDIPGASEVLRPPHAGAANAVGAAIAQVSGEIDQLYNLENCDGRGGAINDAKAKALSAARKAGADETTLNIIDIEEIPMSYIPGDVVRIKVKAIGDLEAAQ